MGLDPSVHAYQQTAANPQIQSRQRSNAISEPNVVSVNGVRGRSETVFEDDRNTSNLGKDILSSELKSTEDKSVDRLAKQIKSNLPQSAKKTDSIFKRVFQYFKARIQAKVQEHRIQKSPFNFKNITDEASAKAEVARFLGENDQNIGKALQEAVKLDFSDQKVAHLKQALLSSIEEKAIVNEETGKANYRLEGDQQVFNFIKLAKDVKSFDEFNQILRSFDANSFKQTMIDSLLLDKKGNLKSEGFAILRYHLNEEFKANQSNQDSLLRGNSLATKLLSRYLAIAGKSTLATLFKGSVDTPPKGKMIEIGGKSFPVGKKISDEDLGLIQNPEAKELMRLESLPSAGQILSGLKELIEKDQIPKELLDVLKLLSELPARHGYDTEKYQGFEFTTFFLRGLVPSITQGGAKYSGTPFFNLLVETGSNLQFVANFNAKFNSKLSKNLIDGLSELREQIALPASAALSQKLDGHPSQIDLS